MESDKGYWALVEPIWEDISIYDGPEVFLRQFEAAPFAARYLFAAHWCEFEVCNGGFDQFFDNSTGILAPEAEAGFREIAMPETAAVVGRAIQLFTSPYPRDRALRQHEKEGIERSVLESLDDEFFDLINDESGGFEAAADAYACRSRAKGEGG